MALPGVVSGAGYIFACNLPVMSRLGNGSTRLTGVFADVRAARGETAGLRLDPAGCRLFPVDDLPGRTIRGACPRASAHRAGGAGL